MQTLQQRIESLEDSNRRLRAIVIAALSIAMLPMILGAAKDRETFNTIVAKRIIVGDENGEAPFIDIDARLANNHSVAIKQKRRDDHISLASLVVADGKSVIGVNAPTGNAQMRIIADDSAARLDGDSPDGGKHCYLGVDDTGTKAARPN